MTRAEMIALLFLIKTDVEIGTLNDCIIQFEEIVDQVEGVIENRKSP